MQTLQQKAESIGKPGKAGQGSRKSKAAFFGTAFFAALLLFAATNFFISKNPPKQHKISEVLQQAATETKTGAKSSHSWAWWLSCMYQEQKQAPDVVVFGSSLLGSAHISADANFENKLLDVLMHRKMSFLQDQLSQRIGHKVSIFSLGSPGQMISDAFVSTKALICSGKKPKLVIATIAPRDFIDNTLPCPAATDHYKFFSKFLDLTTQKESAYPDFFSRLGAEIDRLPLKHAGLLALNQYAEANKSAFAESSISRIEPGKSLVPAKAVPARVDNTAEYKERFRNPMSSSYNAEMRFFNDWLAELKKDGIEVLVVGMPTSPENHKLLPESFWKTYRNDISSACKRNSADWFDLSECGLFQATDYLDTVHLNAYGGLRLFPVIAERITLQESCVKALKN